MFLAEDAGKQLRSSFVVSAILAGAVGQALTQSRLTNKCVQIELLEELVIGVRRKDPAGALLKRFPVWIVLLAFFVCGKLRSSVAELSAIFTVVESII